MTLEREALGPYRALVVTAKSSNQAVSLGCAAQTPVPLPVRRSSTSGRPWSGPGRSAPACSRRRLREDRESQGPEVPIECEAGHVVETIADDDE